MRPVPHPSPSFRKGEVRRPLQGPTKNHDSPDEIPAQGSSRLRSSGPSHRSLSEPLRRTRPRCGGPNPSSHRAFSGTRTRPGDPHGPRTGTNNGLASSTLASEDSTHSTAEPPESCRAARKRPESLRPGSPGQARGPDGAVDRRRPHHRSDGSGVSPGPRKSRGERRLRLHGGPSGVRPKSLDKTQTLYENTPCHS